MIRARGILGLRLLAIVLALSLGACSRSANPIEEAMVADPDEWPTWGRTGHETHYSPLDQIATNNVGKLALAWHYDLEPGYSPTTPIQAEGKLFITTGHSHIRAFAADTGEFLWDYDGGTRQRATSQIHMSWGNKGIAYWGGRVFLGTTDGFVIALDADTGEEVWKVRDFGPDALRNMNGAPRVFDGKVIIGHGGADLSPIRGYVSAYDADTGELAWKFYTVPGDPRAPATNRAEEVMRPTWKGDWFGKGGGGTAWNAFSYDPELDLVYLGIGNGFPYNREMRSPGGGDNLFLASIVAVHADTGDYAWHYQVCPAEQWDCTATTDMTLATLEIDGVDRKVLMQAPKNGFFYVIDRQTGEFISAENIAKVTWAEGIDPKTGRPNVNPGMLYQGKPGFFEMWPGPLGAHSWQPQAYSPRTGFVYVPVIEQGALIGAPQEGGMEITAGMGVTLIPEVELSDGRHSFLRAWNPVTQKLAWQVELPGSWPGGVLATAGDLVFQGHIDGRFVAYDAATGKEVWAFQTESPIVGAPISYRMDGRQYVAVLTGSGGQGAGMQSIGNQAWRTDYRLPRRVLTFALGGSDEVPPFEMPARIPHPDPGLEPDLARAQEGALLYATNTCLVCHGWNAVGAGGAPDLRFSATILDASAFEYVVRRGILKLRGMPGFAGLGDQDLETIRFYLRARAQAFPAEQAALLAKQKAEQESFATLEDFAGSWNIVIQSPVGPQNAVMELSVDGDALSGRVTAEQGTVEVAGGVAEGRAKLSGKASMPFPITIAYDLTVRSGVLTGENSNGPFGTFPVTGTR